MGRGRAVSYSQRIKSNEGCVFVVGRKGWRVIAIVMIKILMCQTLKITMRMG